MPRSTHVQPPWPLPRHPLFALGTRLDQTQPPARPRSLPSLPSCYPLARAYSHSPHPSPAASTLPLRAPACPSHHAHSPPAPVQLQTMPYCSAL